MDELQKKVQAVLSRAADLLEKQHLPDKTIEKLQNLADQVNLPCVVAVVGRVKAGKSTFINALLGVNLAPVGVTETTAIITKFHYGVEIDAEHPVRCHWLDRRVTQESRSFLDDLQGYSPEALNLAEGIQHVEFLLAQQYLKRVTIVDTPGMAAVVEKHEERQRQYIGLCERHQQETQELRDTADAIIFLTGQVGGTVERTFLEEFKQLSGGPSRAFNAIGVMAKIDLNEELLARRVELSSKVARQFENHLNTVLPVSAGLQCALDCLIKNDKVALNNFIVTIRRIPPKHLDFLLRSEGLFSDNEGKFEGKDCPVSEEERRALKKGMDWAVFATIARTAADVNLCIDAVVEQLTELAGFRALKLVLEERFLQRGNILRCYRLVSEAYNVINQVCRDYLPPYIRRDEEERTKLDRFLSFVHREENDDNVRLELANYLRIQKNATNRADQIKGTLTELARELSDFLHSLDEHNQDVESLQLMEASPGEFDAVEVKELHVLFGRNGENIGNWQPLVSSKNVTIEGRASFWLNESNDSRSAFRRKVASWAFRRYSKLLRQTTQS